MKICIKYSWYYCGNQTQNNMASEKNSHLAKWGILGPKIAHTQNSGSAGSIFLKFCTMKGVNW